jgi:K+-transporting ATPase A subunit
MGRLGSHGGVVLCWSDHSILGGVRGNPLLAGVDQRVSPLQSGGNIEGKEVRYGIANSTLWATVTTDTSCAL